ncbi:hypothetical protein [Streptomyces sp. NPDC050504]|uniref:hypothetical protein n=1 Tax=Streptomyces sp. NPDC050504 TaxID=3365618 RepID=UPI0037AA5BC6
MRKGTRAARALTALGLAEPRDGARGAASAGWSAAAAAVVAFLVASEPLGLGVPVSAGIALPAAAGTWLSVKRT